MSFQVYWVFMCGAVPSIPSTGAGAESPCAPCGSCGVTATTLPHAADTTAIENIRMADGQKRTDKTAEPFATSRHRDVYSQTHPIKAVHCLRYRRFTPNAQGRASRR